MGETIGGDVRVGPSAVIARSPCDEAIQTVSADAFLDCFASLAMTSPLLWAVNPCCSGSE
ncbi:hypothetical protein EOW77_0029390 [Bradyrhizobium yuanmingense]|nr:hypothetical protein EOW77_0029390 [Bradyrhizobium yuanmingense]